jgi:hypothetical protein
MAHDFSISIKIVFVFLPRVRVFILQSLFFFAPLGWLPFQAKGTIQRSGCSFRWSH